MRQYTETFKARMVRRLTGPKAVSAVVLSKETGVGQATLSRWLLEAASFRGMSDDPPQKIDPAPRRPQEWSAEEKLQAVVEAGQLDEAKLGEFLRQKGLHRGDIEQWRRSATEGLGRPYGRGEGRTIEEKKIRVLERELRQKEKALAEAAALLVLRKKLTALWAGAADDTDEGNEP